MLKLMTATAAMLLLVISTADAKRHRHYHSETQSAQILAHPEGCPRRAFCGCGVSLKVFGKRLESHYLAAYWFKYPKAKPAHGMVAVRNHHVFYIEKVLGSGRVLAYDPNSGGHQTRLHTRDLAGYSVRDPGGTSHNGTAKKATPSRAPAREVIPEIDRHRVVDADSKRGIASTFYDHEIACSNRRINPYKTWGIAVRGTKADCGTVYEITNLSNGRRVTAPQVDLGPCNTPRCQRSRSSVDRRARSRIVDLLPPVEKALHSNGLVRVAIRVVKQVATR